MRLRPDVTIHTVLLLLILKIEGGNGRVMSTLFSYITNTTFRSVHDTRKGFTDNWIVRFLATMCLIMPTRQIPLQKKHEAFVRIITLKTTITRFQIIYSGESRRSTCMSISPRCSKRDRGERKNTGIRTRVRSWPTPSAQPVTHTRL